MAASFVSFNFGCRVNRAETNALSDKLAAVGFSWQEKNPEIFILNTCAVTQKAEREARQKIYQLKKAHPKSFLVVTGCAATLWQKQKKWGGLPIDLLVPNWEKENIPAIIKAKFTSRQNIKPQANPNKFNSSGRYLLKIQDGCNLFCSYCITAHLRGFPCSKSTECVLREINSLPSGIKEIILTAINTKVYGVDNKENLVALLNAIINQTAISRLSFGSIHPLSLTSDFVDFYARQCSSKEKTAKKLVDFFHVPVQSGSDEILKLMKRGYQSFEVLEKMIALAEINPSALIATDVIVGFVGETDELFAETYNFLSSSPIVKFHVFPYSLRPGTAAFHFKDKYYNPSFAIKKKRVQALIELGAQKYEAFCRKMVGKTSSCLVIKTQGNNRIGLLENQLPVKIKTKKPVGLILPRVQIVAWNNKELMAEEK